MITLNAGAVRSTKPGTAPVNTGAPLRAPTSIRCSGVISDNTDLAACTESLIALNRSRGSGLSVARFASSAVIEFPAFWSPSARIDTGHIATSGLSGSAFCSSR